MSTTNNDDVITRRTIDTERDAPATEIVELVADLEGREPTELPPIYYSVDELIADLFATPPIGEADASLEFTYEGYLFHVRQDGVTTVRDRTNPVPG